MKSNEELNLITLLKDCPKGTKFYSPICGVVEFVTIGGIFATNYPIKTTNNIDDFYFTKEGYYNMKGTPECLLFPSKDQRDWNVWKEQQDKKNTALKVGDYAIDQDNDIVVITKITDSDLGMVKAINNKHHNYSFYLNALTKIDRYPISSFKPFDGVLVRDSNLGDEDNYDISMVWCADFYSHYDEKNKQYVSTGGLYSQCIPYNEETKHLLGKTDKAPEFYTTW